MNRVRTLLSAAFLAGLIAAWGPATQAAPRLPLDDFEKAPEGWTYVGGEEFPGAKGSLVLDGAVAHGGKRSYRLEADFSGGGAYVGTWRDLGSLKGRDISELRFWGRQTGLTKLGVRLLDSSDQIHQSAVALAPSADWQEVILKVSALAGGEHWGGANDGRWHGPLKGFGLNLGKDGLSAGQAKKGALWIDDLEAVPGPVLDGTPTIHAAAVNPGSCRPGWGARITYTWDAEPLGRDYSVFVHYQGVQGTVMQGDHGPSVPTSVWSGRLEYSKVAVIPEDLPDGEYRIVMGLWESATGTRHPLKTTAGVIPLEGNAYQIGVIKVDSKAPLPVLPKPTLRLDDFKLTWSDEFNDLSVSARGPGTRWIAHTPYNGDFGDAGFADPKEGFPFTVDKGILRIEASKENGRWRGGLLSSVDSQGQGFSQKFGYFEMRAKFPKSLGMWPAFWLMGVEGIQNKKIANIEIDVVEQYGSMPNTLMATLHLWGPGDKHWGEGDGFFVPGMTDGFHTYGALVEDKEITIYYDGVELWRQKTPPEAKVPLYIMVDLAMGGGWPIDKAVSPSYMYVDYVRAYARK